MALPTIDTEYLLNFLSDLLNIPSPTGYTREAVDYIEKTLSAFPELKLERTRKGALLVTWPGRRTDQPRALTAHTDTLGAMVKEIKSSGRLLLTQLGSYVWNTIEGEGCTVITLDGKRIRGSYLIEAASSHVHGTKTSSMERNGQMLEIRLDERTSSEKETRALGIEVGDFVAFDPRIEITNGFVRSRHLDDKACVACLVAAVQSMHAAGLQPYQTAYFLISNYEEVGHGAATGFPSDVGELVVVDMAAVGEGQTSDEFNATVCVKDSGGPYHHELSTKLRRLADQNNIPYKVDIYAYYGSDGGALLRTGADLKVALIGPGVDASHNYERTHIDGLTATTQWVMAYLLSD